MWKRHPHFGNVSSLKDFLNVLLKRKHINEELAELLSFTEVNIEDIFYKRTTKNYTITDSSWTDELKQFSYMLWVYSPNTYKFLKEELAISLPTPFMLQKWFLATDGKPGFTKESIDALKRRVQESKHVLYGCMTVGQFQLNPKDDYDCGYEDFGENLETDYRDKANYALIFSVTCLNEYWNIPFAYFRISSVDAYQKANLILACLEILVQVGMTIVAVTFDCHPPNFEVAKILGCSIDPKNMITTFKLPNRADVIVVFFDPSDIMLWIKVSFRTVKKMINNQKKVIQIKYFDKIKNLTEKEDKSLQKKLAIGLHDFHNQKLERVRFPTENLNENMLEALDFCEQNLKGFNRSDASAQFVKYLNNLFDVLTCYPHGAVYKKALTLNDMEYIKIFLLRAEEYIKNLKTENDINIINTEPQTSRGYIGLLACIESSKKLFSYFLEENRLQTLSLNHFTLFPLKLFFCRAEHHAQSNLPAPFQFEYFFKNVVENIKNYSCVNDGVLHLEGVSLFIIDSPIKMINATIIRPDILHEVKDDETDFLSVLLQKNIKVNSLQESYQKLPENSEYIEYVPIYVAGYVVKNLMKEIECDVCINALLSKECAEEYYTYVGYKKKRGLIYPSEDSIKICRLTERVMKQYVTNELPYDPKLTKLVIARSILTIILDKCNNIFSNLNEHQKDQPPEASHFIQLVKAITEKYIELRMKKYAAAYLNEHPELESCSDEYHSDDSYFLL